MSALVKAEAAASGLSSKRNCDATQDEKREDENEEEEHMRSQADGCSGSTPNKESAKLRLASERNTQRGGAASQRFCLHAAKQNRRVHLF